jgi:hypothetical protein
MRGNAKKKQPRRHNEVSHQAAREGEDDLEGELGLRHNQRRVIIIEMKSSEEDLKRVRTGKTEERS